MAQGNTEIRLRYLNGRIIKTYADWPLPQEFSIPLIPAGGGKSCLIFRWHFAVVSCGEDPYIQFVLYRQKRHIED